MEIQNAQGSPLAGYTLHDAHFLNWNSMYFVAAWKDQEAAVAELPGKSIGLRFKVRDANLLQYQFEKV